MPIFEYRCGDCGEAFEAFVTAERTPECPSCHGDNLAKLLSTPALVGSGNGRPEPTRFPASGGCGMGTSTPPRSGRAAGAPACGCRPDTN